MIKFILSNILYEKGQIMKEMKNKLAKKVLTNAHCSYIIPTVKAKASLRKTQRRLCLYFYGAKTEKYIKTEGADGR